jgi:hypothetical protein
MSDFDYIAHSWEVYPRYGRSKHARDGYGTCLDRSEAIARAFSERGLWSHRFIMFNFSGAPSHYANVRPSAHTPDAHTRYSTGERFGSGAPVEMPGAVEEDGFYYGGDSPGVLRITPHTVSPVMTRRLYIPEARMVDFRALRTSKECLRLAFEIVQG